MTSMTERGIIEVNNVTKTYGAVVANKDTE